MSSSPPSAKPVLMVAAYFPPSGRVGAKRALRLARDLTAAGWTTTVLTLDEASSARLGGFIDETLLEGAPGLRTVRARAWLPGVDLSRWGVREMERGGLRGGIGRLVHLVGRLVESLCLPDPLVGWLPLAFRSACRIVREGQIGVIIATARPFSSLVLAWLVSLRTGLPYVLDYRDPWTTQTDPRSRPPALRRAIERRIEAAVARRASHVFFASQTRARHYEEAMGLAGTGKVSWLPNTLETLPSAGPGGPAAGEPRVLLHAGNLYGGRTLIPLLQALEALEQEGQIEPSSVVVEVRGSLDRATRSYARTSPRVSRFLRVEPPMTYPEIGARMRSAAALLLVVAPEHAADVPAKLFDYLASGRPILSLAPRDSEAADLVRRLGAGIPLEPSDEPGLREALLGVVRGELKSCATADSLAGFSASEVASRVVRRLEEATSPRPPE